MVDDLARPKLKICLAEADYIKKPFNVISGLICEARIRVEADRITITEMDPANVAMTVWKLLSSACVEFDCEPQEFCIRIDDVKKVLKSATRLDMLVIEHSEDMGKIDFILKGKSVRRYTIATIQNDSREQKAPDLQLNVKVVIPSDKFAEQINEACGVAESVSFFAEHNKCFDLTALGDINKLNIENRGDDTEIYVSDKPQKCKYSLEYLKKMVKAECISNEVIIEFSSDYPVRLTYRVIDKYEMQFFLAPRVEG